MNLKFRDLCLVVLAWQAGTAMASNLRFLDDTPVSRFNQQDMRLLQDSLDKAMNEAADGTTVEWANDKTGAGGTITPNGRFERTGTECRKARLTTRFKTLKGGGEYNFCKGSQGQWQMVQ
jgi:surface antigen